MTDQENKEQEIVLNILYGYCELRSWFEFDGDKMIGMGSKKTYDRDGNLIDYSESQTGLVATIN